MSVIAKNIDLRNFSKEIFDQGSEGSCVANAVCEAIRIQSREYRQDTGELAREQIYYDARTVKSADAGVNPANLLKAAMTTGIASQVWALPYGGYSNAGPNMFQKPSEIVYQNAATQKVTGYTDLSDWLFFKDGVVNKLGSAKEIQDQVKEQIGTQLMHGKAVLLGFDCPKWFYAIGTNKPLEQQTDHNDTSLVDLPSKAHEVIIVGMNDTLNGGSYIVQNSWSDQWGDHGYAAIPYAFMAADPSSWVYSISRKVFAMTSLQVIDGFKGVDQKWTAERSNVAMAYSSVLDRAVEREALEAGSNQLKSGTSLQQFTNNLMSTNEAKQLYGTMTDGDFINTLYHNILGRDVDGAGKQFWGDKIATHVMTRGDVAYNLMTTVLNTSGHGVGAPTTDEHDFLVNRTTVSENYGLTYQVNAAHIDLARSSLDNVSAEADTVQAALIGIQHALYIA